MATLHIASRSWGRWLLGALVALHCAAALAQLRPAMDIYIEKFTPETGDCGVADLPLRNVSTLTLENSGLRVLEKAPVFLYVHPLVLQEGSSCFVHLDVSVRARSQLAAMEGYKIKEGWVGVLLSSATVSGLVPQAELASSLMNQLVQQIKLCLENLEY